MTLSQNIFNHINNPIFVVDCQYHYIAFNQAHVSDMKAIYGIEIELGKSILAYITVSEDRAVMKENIDRALAGEELIVQSLAGNAEIDRRYYEIKHAPLKENGNIVGAIVLTQDITNLNLANAQLRKLSQAVEYSPVSIIITSIDGTIEYVNAKFCELTGYTFEESIGKNPKILKSTLTPKNIYYSLWKTILSGQEWRGEFINQKKNGEYYHELASISPIQNEEGEISHFVAIKEDITERKRIEEEFNKNQANLTALIENTTDSIWSVDADYKITTANSNFKRDFKTAFNITLEIGSDITDILGQLSPELKEQWKGRYDRALKGECFAEVDHFLIEDVPEYTEAAFNPIRINDEVVGVSVFSHDITNRKQIQKELQESEERYRLIAENTGDVIWIFDLTAKKFSYVSPSSSSLRGYSSEEVLGQTIDQVLTPESYAYVTKEIPIRLAAFKAGDESELHRTEHLQHQHKKGHIVDIEIVTTLLMNEEGNVTSILGVSRNITKRKQVENELKKANQELQEHIQTVEALQEKLREQATRDSITGLFNHHHMQATLEQEMALAKKNNLSIGLIMLDIDNFKKINDTYGHDAGNLVLKKMAEVIKENTRGYDIPCRYGGDEFLIIMPNITSEIIELRAISICDKFNASHVSFEGQDVHTTLSIGVLARLATNYTGSQLLNYVDKALYVAKRAGRNQVCVYQEDEYSI